MLPRAQRVDELHWLRLASAGVWVRYGEGGKEAFWGGGKAGGIVGTWVRVGGKFLCRIQASFPGSLLLSQAEECAELFEVAQY